MLNLINGMSNTGHPQNLPCCAPANTRVLWSCFILHHVHAHAESHVLFCLRICQLSDPPRYASHSITNTVIPFPFPFRRSSCGVEVGLPQLLSGFLALLALSTALLSFIPLTRLFIHILLFPLRFASAITFFTASGS